ncbi:hypothetical protein H072_4278 [Dactylellina haptotyla CBS 200.50]|uniref:Chloride channel protein n=1 Tax=Dactylellina haptotyla (strain CBS 200.50) TaxID=1284197 RepID=S8AFD5_DACHA|nr:hypothetical protein H072_4278 [Dactylellina haptotyla CBS 200.50]
MSSQLPPSDLEANDETPLITVTTASNLNTTYQLFPSRESRITDDGSSIISKEEQAMAATSLGERLPYNDYNTIDWLHDLVKASVRRRQILSGSNSISISVFWDNIQGWVVAFLVGLLMANVAYMVDVAQATVFDWKEGYCSTGPFRSHEVCCSVDLKVTNEQKCGDWKYWTDVRTGYALYVAVATAGSGIPEIKTILSGFVIKGFLSFKVLYIKAIGAVFAVASGMCLGKEGPFVHISACVGNVVSGWFPKYSENGRKRREVISAACAAGLSVAFGAPIGGVLFSFEEISTYFPRKVLWRSFFCSLVAAVTLKFLNPLNTGKLVLFQTSYGSSYDVSHYPIFALLGVAGGVFGAIFCKANYQYSKRFRKYSFVKGHPVIEVLCVVVLTGLLQYPSRLTREGGDVLIKNMLVDCAGKGGYPCEIETNPAMKERYIWMLVSGVLIKLFLTTITFGCKIPSGIIIPALDAGALFGRLVGFGLWAHAGGYSDIAKGVSPGVFAMVGAAAFLAGVTRMTLSLCVIMFELTGELEYVVPHMCAILVAKWTADLIEPEGIYDLAQSILGHPFLDVETSNSLIAKDNYTVSVLMPPRSTIEEITLMVPPSGIVTTDVLQHKMDQLKRRNIGDAGLVLVAQEGRHCLGYLFQSELAYGLENLCNGCKEVQVVKEYDDIYGNNGQGVGPLDDIADITAFVDETPVMLRDTAPVEVAVEMFGRLGIRCLIIVGARGEVLGAVIKKRLLSWLERVKEGKEGAFSGTV